jgi:hypothetical protein
MAGIKDYSTTAASNTSVGGISIAEGMLPSNINNAFRAITADIREWFNDSQWIIYGDGDGAFTIAYGSGTTFTVSGVDVTDFYHVGRRVKAIAATPGTIFGTISATTFSTNTTVTVTWDSGSLANEAVTIYVGALSKTNDSIPELVITNAKVATSAAIDATKIHDGSVSNTEFGYLNGVTSAIQTQINSLQASDAELTAIAGLTSAANKGIEFTGSGTAAVFDLTTAGKALLDDADATTQRTTLGLGTIATQNANNVTVTGGSITGLGTPSSSSDAATKNYVDDVVAGLRTRIVCRAASTANVNIASELENGDVLDGVTLVTGNRVLLKNQTSGLENGIYTVVSTGAASRDTEYDVIGELAGQMVIIQEGTANADTFFLCSTNTSATLETDTITFTIVTPQNTGTVTSIVAGTGLSGGTITNAGTIAIDSTVTTLTGSQTLTNKTLTAPKIANAGFIADANGNEQIKFTTTASAVNELTVTNNATGNNPIISATGGDTNIGIVLTPKGTGEVVIATDDLNYAGTAVTATGAELNYNDLATLGTTAASKVFTADANNLTKVSGAVLNIEDTLTDGATITWNVIDSPVAKVTLGGNRTISAPSGTTPAAGQFIAITVIQDATGSRVLTWNSAYEFTADTAPTLTTTASKADVFVFKYNGTVWHEVGRNLNLSIT